MSDLATLTALKNKIDELFYENTTGDISGADGNEMLQDIVDTIENWFTWESGSGSNSLVQQDNDNEADGVSSFAIGEKCKAKADYSQAFGKQAIAWLKNSIARSSGKFSIDGDRQYVQAFLYANTEDDTPANMTIDGSIEGVEIPDDCQVFFKVRLNGVQNGGENGSVGDSLVFMAEGAIKNLAGTVSLIGEGTFSEMLIPDGLSQASIRIFADNSLESTPLQIEVTGQELRSVLWFASIELNVVGFRNFAI
jgi:hypothetical protein